MCVTDRHDMPLAVKVALDPKTTNQVHESRGRSPIETDIPTMEQIMFKPDYTVN